MASVKTGAGRARAHVWNAIGSSRGESPESRSDDHRVVAMASVKTGAGRAGARAGDAIGASRGKRPGDAGLLPSSFTTTSWAQKGGARASE